MKHVNKKEAKKYDVPVNSFLPALSSPLRRPLFNIAMSEPGVDINLFAVNVFFLVVARAVGVSITVR